jgi:hypothetical protein
MKSLKTFYFITGMIPWSFTISLLVFYFHACIILGHLPSYNHPDPKELSVYTFYSPIIDGAMFALFGGFILWLIFSVVALIIKQRRLFVNRMMLYALCYLIAFILFYSGISGWYAD